MTKNDKNNRGNDKSKKPVLSLAYNVDYQKFKSIFSKK